MLPKSIRWRLPLSYAGIALLATIALGAVLLTTLRGYYALRERDNLMNNAQLISDIVTRAKANNQPQDEISNQITVLSFISQSRIQLFDADHKLIVNSGNPAEKQVTTYPVPAAQMRDNMLFLNNTGQEMPSDFGQLFAIARVQVSHTVPAGTNVSVFPKSTEGDPPQLQAFPENGTTSGQVTTPTGESFGFSVASSPYGIGLKRDATPASWSNESVTVQILDSQQQPIGTVEVSNGPAYGTEIIGGVTWALIGAGAAAVLLAAAAGWFMSRTMTAPLLLLTHATAQMAQGELSTRVGLKRTDEFGTLAHSFDEMATRVETTVVALRRFVADAAHEMHTPLTAVHADLELAASEPDAPRQQMFIERALSQLKRLEVLTNDLLDLSRLEAHAVDDRRARVDLGALVRELSEAFASRADQAGIAFNVETPEQPINVSINETQFRHAIGNLLDNAIKFTPENGSITVGVRRDGDQVELWVNDTGIGIAAEDLPQLFNRFHRGRNAAAYPGSGLGLAIIKAIVEGHHGQITVQSAAGGGTHFALRVPAGA